MAGETGSHKVRPATAPKQPSGNRDGSCPWSLLPAPILNPKHAASLKGMADNALEGMIRKAHHWPQRHRATEKTWPRISRIRRKQAGGFVPVFASCSLTTYTVCDRRKFVAKNQRD